MPYSTKKVHKRPDTFECRVYMYRCKDNVCFHCFSQKNISAFKKKVPMAHCSNISQRLQLNADSGTLEIPLNQIPYTGEV